MMKEINLETLAIKPANHLSVAAQTVDDQAEGVCPGVTQALANRSSKMNLDSDALLLARLGKRQVLRRNFAFVSMLAFSCTILSTWEGVLILLAPGLQNGGLAGLVYQFILVWGGTLCTFITIGELASIAPTAAGQYHWVAMLAPKSMRNFSSYIVGWTTMLAWIATLSTGAFLTATMIQQIIGIAHADYQPRSWHALLLTEAVLLLCVIVVIRASYTLPRVEAFLFFLHILAFFVILIVLLYFAPHGRADKIFSNYLNLGGWSTYGLSFMVGTLGLAFSFVGADAAVHVSQASMLLYVGPSAKQAQMSEEMVNAAVNVPRTIVAGIVVNGLFGFGMLLTVIFCIGDPTDLIREQSPNTYIFIRVFHQATGSAVGACSLVSLLVILCFASSLGFLATGSRVVWSFARDKGLPFSDTLNKVDKRTRIPMISIFITAFLPALLVLIIIGSSVVFYDVTSLALSGFYCSYLICCALLLFRRIKGDVKTDNGPRTEEASAFYNGRCVYTLVWGPWHVKGVAGIIINSIACVYLLVIWLFSFFPPMAPVNAASMNYSSLVFGAVVMYSMLHYAVWGRRQYKGPINEVTFDGRGRMHA